MTGECVFVFEREKSKLDSGNMKTGQVVDPVMLFNTRKRAGYRDPISDPP